MKPTDADLVLFADGKLDAQRTQRLLESAKSDSGLRETLAALEASRLPYKAAFDRQSLPPIPDHLRDEIAQLQGINHTGADHDRPALPSWRKPVAQIACVLLLCAMGYGAGVYQTQSQIRNVAVVESDPSSVEQMAANQVHEDWVERVADYQSLYVANTVKDTSVDIAATKRWLETVGRSSGVQTIVPDLSVAGYQFKRAQELGYEGRTLLQLVYTKEGRLPLALCFMPTGNETDIPLLISEHHGLTAASWIARDQHYVLVADEPEDMLRQLHETTEAEFSRQI